MIQCAASIGFVAEAWSVEGEGLKESFQRYSGLDAEQSIA